MKIDPKKNRFVGSSFRCDRCDGAGSIHRDLRPGQTSVPELLNEYNSRECPACLGEGVAYLYEDDPKYNEEQKQDTAHLLKEIALLQKRNRQLLDQKDQLIKFYTDHPVR